jgi:trans-2,3-dihydro-3-hydroxyanthranilate isomerase
VDETAIVATTHEPVVASVGTPFVFVELATLGALERAAPQVEAFRQAADTTPGMDLHFAVHLYVRQARPDTVRARMFAPLAGVVEDPATGSAAAALAALLTSRGPHTEQAFVIEQGQETGRPSQMEAAARRDADGTVRAWVGGRCVPVMSGRLEL